MKKLLITLVLILVFIAGTASYIVLGSYSDGFRAGTLIKFSKKGYVFKTYEGQLNLGMILNDDRAEGPNSVANIWDFSVDNSNEKVVQTIDEALLNGKRIKLHYKEKFVKMPWSGDTKYFVYDAEIVK